GEHMRLRLGETQIGKGVFSPERHGMGGALKTRDEWGGRLGVHTSSNYTVSYSERQEQHTHMYCAGISHRRHKHGGDACLYPGGSELRQVGYISLSEIGLAGRCIGRYGKESIGAEQSE